MSENYFQLLERGLISSASKPGHPLLMEKRDKVSRFKGRKYGGKTYKILGFRDNNL